MSIVLRHRFLVTDLFVVPFHTRHGIAFHYIARNSVLHIHQKVPIAALKRSPKAPLKLNLQNPCKLNRVRFKL
ncbi:unnamed protein product [Brassica oleracea var. botrytis]